MLRLARLPGHYHNSSTSTGTMYSIVPRPVHCRYYWLAYRHDRETTILLGCGGISVVLRRTVIALHAPAPPPFPKGLMVRRPPRFIAAVKGLACNPARGAIVATPRRLLGEVFDA